MKPQCQALIQVHPSVVGWEALGVSEVHSVAAAVVFFFFWPYHVACGILVPQPGIKYTSLSLEAGSLNH